jgi:uncharacterized repeat protein (TIGR01451 family)
MSSLKFILTLLTVFSIFSNGNSQSQIGQDIDGEAPYDFSGGSISMPDNRTIAIGASKNDGNGIESGHVRIYTWNGTNWVQKGVDIDGETSSNWSGNMVCMPDTNTVAIGAPINGNFDRGHVRIFEWSGTAWVQKGADIDGVQANEWSGIREAVSMPDANTVAIGAFRSGGGFGLDVGQVRIFEWSGTAWIQKGADINGTHYYATLHAVSMPNANTIAVGAPGDAEYVQVYDWNGMAWTQRGINIDNGGGNDDNFGGSLCMPDTNTLAIGASGTGTLAGMVRVFKWNGTLWEQKGTDINGIAAVDNFGCSVSMPNSNTLLVGADNANNGTNAGYARVYNWNGVNWVQIGNDIEGEVSGDRFGWFVDMTDNNTFGIGAHHHDNRSGHVRVFKLKGVYGWVFNDINQNCTQEEIGVVHGITGIVQPGGIVVQTNSNGVWFIDSLSAGSYSITFDTTGNWQPTCPNQINFAVTDPNELMQADSLGMFNLNPCPELSISIYMPFMRPGFSDQIIYVKACNSNTGSEILVNPYVEVSLDDSLTLDTTSLVYTSLGNNTFSFDLDVDTLRPGDCVDFTLSTTLSANAVLSRTLCLEAELFPIDSCSFDTLVAPAPPDFIPCSLPWDRSSLEIEGKCLNDSIFFTIRNTGLSGVGDMNCFSPLRLYIDGVYIWLDSIQLVGGDSVVFSFAGDGKTWRMEADQHPLHPGDSHPNATIERCGNSSNWTPDLVNIFPHDDFNPINDIYCGLITGSYDPNDKKGLPTGVGPNNLVAPNGKIDYKIRFQNTGTDTAFTVVIRDTLDSDLDIFSVVSGVSSHPYSFEIYGPRVLQWTFSNILLPDSTTNEPESNGFVTFTVNQVNDLLDGTEISNTADIYFDFNASIITNTTSHKIGREILEASWTEEYDTNITLCDSLLYNGDSYNQSGTFFQVIEGVTTDTLVTLNLTINKSNFGTDIDTVCDSFTWIDGVTYTSSNNTATHTLTNVIGCDSIVTLNLIVKSSTTGTDVVTACDSYIWIDGATYTSSNNSATYTLTNEEGCDSVVTLNLTVNNSSNGTDVVVACDSYTWIDGVTYTSSNNTATHTLTNVEGCDSVVALNLTINSSSSSTDVLTTCDSYTWIDGITYTSSNSAATYVLTNSVGCDSVVTLNLTVNNSNVETDVLTVCDSHTWIDGVTYTSSNNAATHTLTNVEGCDSVVTLNLTVNNSSNGTDLQIACDSFTWINGVTYTSSNTTDTLILINSMGCDSVLHLDLTINTVSDLTTSVSGITIIANNTNASYVWLDCDSSYIAVTDEKAQTFTPSKNGNYAAQLAENGCLDTTSCVSITNIGILKNTWTEDFLLFPNPTHGELTITFENDQEEIQLIIYSVSGELLQQISVENSSEIKVDLEGSSGTYLLQLKSNGQEATIRVIKN